MRTIPAWLFGVSLVVWLAPGAIPASAQERDTIVIGPKSLSPVVLGTMLERTVTFVNRSGQLVHVEFHGRNGHRVAQVPGKISAVFHRPGRHEYVVHFESRGAEIHGAVDVADDPEAVSGPPTCPSVTVTDACIDP